MSTFLVIEFTRAGTPSESRISSIVAGVRAVALVSNSPLFVFTVTSDNPNHAFHLLSRLGPSDDVKQAYLLRGDAFTLGDRESGGYKAFTPSE